MQATSSCVVQGGGVKAPNTLSTRFLRMVFVWRGGGVPCKIYFINIYICALWIFILAAQRRPVLSVFLSPRGPGVNIRGSETVHRRFCLDAAACTEINSLKSLKFFIMFFGAIPCTVHFPVQYTIARFNI